MTTPGPFTARPLEDGVWIVVGRDDDQGDTHTVCRAEPCETHRDPDDPNKSRAQADAEAIEAALNGSTDLQWQLDQYRDESRRLGDFANAKVQELKAARAARDRIAEAHHKHVDAHGGTWGECNECGHSWPCPTYAWATTDRDVNACWDPADDTY